MTTSEGPSPEGSAIGPYQIEKRLGAGGMGEVYLARDERLGRLVAIKRIRADRADDPTYRERLIREARSVARLSHPSVVQIYDIVEEADQASIVMEYVEGRTLADVLRTGELDGDEVLDALIQITDGLQAAHEAGLIHRDLKGENVLVSATGVKILDFGIAKSISQRAGDAGLTVEGLGVGTVRAMSPEQSEGATLGAPADLFSLGVLMYEALTGRSPFLAKTEIATVARVVAHDPPPPVEINASLPAALSELTMALLSKGPMDRPSSAAAVGDALAALRDADALAGVVLPPLRLEPDARSHPSSEGTGDPRRPTRRSRHRRGRTTGGAGQAPPAATRGRSRLLAAVAGIAAVVVALSAMWLVNRPTLDDGRIVVYPLVGGADVPAAVGEDVATLIGHALDGVAALTWIDGWSALDAPARADVRVLDLGTAAALARGAGSAHFVTGRVVLTDDSARVFLDLRDARSGDRVGGGEALAAATEPWRAGLGAMSTLLPALIQTAVPDLGADFSRLAPGAVASFLRGEAAHRRASVRESLEHFRTAFAADSSFALAGIRAAQAASWEHDQEAAGELLEAVLRLPLPPTSEAFARGVLAYVRYDAETAIEQLDLAVAADSSLTVGWAALGEVYRHRAPRVPWLTPPRPFAVALTQDSLAGYVLFHRLEELIRDGDVGTASRLRDRFRTGQPDANLMFQIDRMYECVANGPTSRDWTSFTLQNSRSVAFAGGQLLMRGAQLPCAEALFRSVLIADTTTSEAEGRFWSSFLGLTASNLARGDFADARRLILAASQGFEPFASLVERSSVTAEGVVLPEDTAPWSPREVPLRRIWEGSLTRWSELAILVAAVHPELADLGALGAADIRSIGGYEQIPYRTSIWMLGLHEARSGRPSEGARAVARLRTFALEEEGPDGPYTERAADALEAHVLLAQGDSLGALTRLRELTANAREGVVYAELIGSFGYERLVLAQLEERLGTPESALPLVRGFEEPNAVANALYLRPALEVCGRAATRVGRDVRATECRMRIAQLASSGPGS